MAYGWYHRRTLQSTHDRQKLQHAAHDRERLIAEAKDAWKRKQEAANDTSGALFVLHVRFILALSFDTLIGRHISCLLFLPIHANFYSFLVVSDPEDPRFDLEKLIAKWEKS